MFRRAVGINSDASPSLLPPHRHRPTAASTAPSSTARRPRARLGGHLPNRGPPAAEEAAPAPRGQRAGVGLPRRADCGGRDADVPGPARGRLPPHHHRAGRRQHGRRGRADPHHGQGPARRGWPGARADFRQLRAWIEETESLLALGVIGRDRKEVGLLVETAFRRYNACFGRSFEVEAELDRDSDDGRSLGEDERTGRDDGRNLLEHH
ncbi:hypothetical protein OPQ81_000107 [Rhizoctonia solani]|nr:hypothetical protein OPQ81_000107 [Rhizoctonia solani]